MVYIINLELFSPLSKKEVCIGIKNLADFDSDGVKFRGTVLEDSFSIYSYRFIDNRTLRPLINAVLIEKPDGTLIKINATLRKIDKIVYSVIIVFCLILSAFFVAVALKEGSFEVFSAVMPILIFTTVLIFIWTLTFFIRLKKSIKLLKKELLIK